MPPPILLNVPALPSTSFYTISHSSTLDLQTHLDTFLATLTPTIQTLLATWAARVGTIPDKDFQTLDSAVKILQTHQPDPTIVCPLLGELGDPVTPETRIIALSQLVQFALHQFSAAGGRSRNSIPETHETGSISHTPRSATVTSSCRTRDGNRSILSACPFPLEVAHIIPRAAGNVGGGAFWWLVEMFLGVGGAEELRVFAFGDGEDGLGCTDTVANTMCLSSSEHELFDRGMWEIVPILDGVLPYAASTCAEYSARIGFISKKPIGLATYITTPAGGARITGEIMDGHLIKLQTPNPAELPLPHPLLLQLHSVFARILHLKASAGYPETESSEGSAGWVGDLVEMDPDKWAQRLTRRLLALGKVGREERIDGWVKSVPLEVVEVPGNEMLEEEVRMAPGVEKKEQGDKEKEEEGEEYVEHAELSRDDASSQWQTPTPATSTYADQRGSNKMISLGELEEASTIAVGRETYGGRAEGG